PYLPVARGERAAEHVRGAPVLAPRVTRAAGRHLPVAAPAAVEQATEDRRRVEAAGAIPVHRAVAADQRRRVTVADQRVIGDRRIASPVVVCWAHHWLLLLSWASPPGSCRRRAGLPPRHQRPAMLAHSSPRGAGAAGAWPSRVAGSSRA